MKDYMEQTNVKEILKRTHLIDDERDSAKIVENIMTVGEPIGVDMEGHHCSNVGLVQMKTSDGFFIFFELA